MSLGLAWLMAAIGVAALVFGVLSKDKKKRIRVTMGIVGVLIILASLVYISLAYILINAV